MTGLDVGQAGPLAVHVAIDRARALVRLIGELDLAGAPRAAEAIEHAERAAPATLELDLSSLEFIDSTGLRLMIEARRRAQATGRRLVLRPGPPPVQRVFEVTALASLFEFVD